MTIKEIGTIPQELPPARLYLDDLEEIVSILSSCNPFVSVDNATAPPVAHFIIGNFDCTDLKELKNFGSRTSKLNVQITRNEKMAAGLYIGRDTIWQAGTKSLDEEFLIYGKLNALFQLRKIRWHAGLRELPLWMLLLMVLTILPSFRDTALFSLPFHSDPHFLIKALVVVLLGILLTIWSFYRLYFAPTIVEFRRVHDPKGFRLRLTEWKPYIVAAVIGGIITRVLDLVTSLLKK